MATKLFKVYGGEKGYVPVKSNSHGGIDVGKAYNGDIVTVITSIPAEYGYAQVTKESDWVTSDTREYWIETSHLKPAIDPLPDPEPSGEWKEYHYRIEDGKLFLKEA